MNEYLPLIIALISATTVLVGYIYEKRKEREFQLRETRKEIHKELIANIIKKFALTEKLRTDLNAPQFTPQTIQEYYAFIESNHSELWKNIEDGVEIQALMSIYGTDEAIKATANFWHESIDVAQGVSNTPANLPAMILKLRHSLFSDTSVTEDDIKFMISK